MTFDLAAANYTLSGLRPFPVAVTTVHEQLLGAPKRRMDTLMGSDVDALKLVSSMTLFAEVAKDAAVGDLPDVDRIQKMAVQILGVARAAGYAACGHTLAALR